MRTAYSNSIILILGLFASQVSVAKDTVCEKGLMSMRADVNASTPASTDLEFELQQGKNEANYFLRHGGNAVHTAVTSGKKSSVVVAFAAQNSADTLWLDAAGSSIKLDVISKPRHISNGALQGASFTIQTDKQKVGIQSAI